MLAVYNDQDLVLMTALFCGVIKPFASSHWFSPFLIYFKIRRWGQTIYIAVGTVQEGRFFVGGNRHCLFYPFPTHHTSVSAAGCLRVTTVSALSASVRPIGGLKSDSVFCGTTVYDRSLRKIIP